MKILPHPNIDIPVPEGLEEGIVQLGLAQLQIKDVRERLQKILEEIGAIASPDYGCHFLRITLCS